MRDLHQMVVDDVGKMIRWISVRFDYDRITFDGANIRLRIAIHQIVEVNNSWLQFESVWKNSFNHN